MVKARSPRYPQISLPEAVEKVRAVYEQDHLNRIPKEVVAEHMGYGGLHGKSLGVISAVAKYGLLFGPSSGMQVTDRALSILACEKGSPERMRAVSDAARGPALFNELLEEYPNGASDQTIKSYLLSRKRFLPNAVDGVIRAFRNTLTFLEDETGCDLEDGNQSNKPVDSVHQDRVRNKEPGSDADAEAGLLHSSAAAEVLQAKSSAIQGPKILFDMETITVSGQIKSADQLREFLGKLKKLLPLMACDNGNQQ